MKMGWNIGGVVTKMSFKWQEIFVREMLASSLDMCFGRDYD